MHILISFFKNMICIHLNSVFDIPVMLSNAVRSTQYSHKLGTDIC